MKRVLNRIAVAIGPSIIASIILAACSSGTQSGNTVSLTVFAAGSLTESFTEVAAAFEQANPAISVDLNFAGSQRLRVQLENGARADVFASADQRHMDLAIEAGLMSGEASNFASNVLVIVLPHATTTEASSIRSPADLAEKGIKLAIAQPEVPAGNYTRAVIQRLAQDPRLRA